MYTLTRKLSVVCLTVVLSFLVYGCGGSSKQALITDVSLDMVTADLTPAPGTYSIQPGGTANAGDVTFACPEGGSSCEVTVDDDGNIVMSPSAEGMATAMDSASAAARLEAERLQGVAEDAQAEAERLQGVAEGAQAEAERLQGVAEGAQAEAERLQGVAEGDTAEAERLQGVAEDARDEAERLQGVAEGDTAEAERLQGIAEGAQAEAERLQGVAEGDTDEAERLQGIAEDARDEAERLQGVAEGDTAEAERLQGVAEGAQAEAERLQGVAEGDTAEAERLQGIAEDARDEANRLKGIAEAATAEAERLQGVAEGERDEALLAQAAAEEEARLLTTVTTIDAELAMDYSTVAPGIYRIEPGKSMVVDDAKITCPGGEAGVICVVVVTVTFDDEGAATVNYTSLGGVAMVVNSDSVTVTREAVALGGFGAGDAGTNVAGALNAVPSDAAPVIGVKRTTSTDESDSDNTDITLTHAGDNDYKATDETDYRIDGWPGQTLKRDDSTDDAEAMNNDEVTVYTNIDSATKMMLTYGAGNVPPLSNTVTFVLDAGQDDDDDINMDIDMADTVRSITGVFSGIPGEFTCDDTIACGEITTVMNDGGDRVLSVNIGSGWTFESDDYVESSAMQDDNYMYFGYWLNSPVEASDDPAEYNFDVIVGGSNTFAIESGLSGNDDDVLTAVYEGGAAGGYATRKLRLENQEVDPQSPGYHGRFTGRARLEANFGVHEDVEEDDRNTIGGSITEIMDGDKDLGFGVITLGRSMIASDGMVDGMGMTKANFSDTAENTGGKGTGDWSGRFYGPSAAELNAPLLAEDPDATGLADIDSTLPTGFAGEFDVSSNSGHTRVVGGFAAERTN